MLTTGFISFKAIGRKLAECLWFWTPLVFCYTTVKQTNQIHFLNLECERIMCEYWPPKISHSKFLGTEHQKNHFSPISVLWREKCWSLVCAQFWCRRPPILFEPLYSKEPKNNPTHDMVSTVWCPGLSRFGSTKTGDFEVFFLHKNLSPGQMLNFCLCLGVW